jgi:HAD superfamily hydrolase (TIGR01509 family)
VTGSVTRPEAVVFDFFGTLAGHQSDEPVGTVSPDGGFLHAYLASLTLTGCHVDAGDLVEHLARFDGAVHPAHDSDAWDSWVRQQYSDVFTAIGVEDVDIAVEALRTVDNAPVHIYPDVIPVLEELVSLGIEIAVCSNWGWDLGERLDELGLGGFVSAAITSAQVGSFKPHGAIYRRTFDALRADPASVVFVGDSFRNDVHGALAAGAGRAIHLIRDPGAQPSAAPEVVRSFPELLAVLVE